MITLLASAFAGSAPTPEMQTVLSQLQQAVTAERRAFSGVPVVVMSPEEATEHLRSELTTWMSTEDWRRAGLLMVAVDLLPTGDHLLGGLVNVLELGTYGFYDPTAGMFVIVERDDPELTWDQVAAHEIVHVFQDDAFDIRLGMAPSLDNSDVVNAFNCLMEGEATYIEHLIKYGATIHDADLSEVVLGLWPEMPAIPTPPGVPLALVEQMSFSYTVGAKFIQQVRRSGGWSAVDRLYRRPPLSTEQALHPERLAGPLRDRPTAVALDLAGVVPGFTPVATDSMGELSVASMFRVWGAGPAAWTLAQGWDGDRMVVLEDDKGEWLLAWRTIWDTDGDAIAFAEAIDARWRGEVGFVVERRVNQVVVLRGAPAESQQALLAATWMGKTREAKRVQHLVNAKALRRWSP